MKTAELGIVDVTPPRPRVIVAIPVRNERDRIVACLDALSAQVGLEPGQFGIVLFLNNCTDGTADVVSTLDGPWPTRVLERTDPAASAGWARRLAMDAADAWLGEGGRGDGVLLTTDADSRVAPDWVFRNLAAIAAGAGADAVAGRISLDAAESALLPESLHVRGRREAEYEALLTEIEARLDPEPGNPWPCHWSKSGATIAVRQAVYRHVGGMPDMPAGEDRAFIDAVRAFDFVVRHEPGIEVVTSGRLDGRAVGGVADTIRLRCDVPESPCDDRLERLDRLVARALRKRLLRWLFAGGWQRSIWLWAPTLSIARPAAIEISAARSFGQAYSRIEAESPALVYRPICPAELPDQIHYATLVVRLLRAVDRLRRFRPRMNTSTILPSVKRTLPSPPWARGDAHEHR